jgi:hypothetical protein
MEQIECSETSANINQTPGKHPKDSTLNIKHGESLKSRTYYDVLFHTHFMLSQSLYIFILRFYCIQTVSYRTDAEVAQKETQSLPEDGIVLPKHVGAIVKEK